MNLHRRHWLALLLAFILLAAGCKEAREHGAGEELVWAAGALDAPLAGEIADRWNRSHPNGPAVRVEALAQSSDEQRQVMAIELNAHMPTFDVLSLDVIWTGEFAENGWLADLEGLRGEIQTASQAGPFQSATWQGKLWAAPLTSNAGFLYYRSDLVPTPPKTWQELMSVGLEAGRRAGIAPFVGQGAQYEGMVVNFLEYFWGAGGDLFNQDGTSVRFPEQPALRALEFMRLAHENGFYAPQFSTMKEEDARLAFQSGGAVFMRNWPYAYSELSRPDSRVRDKFAIAPLPTFDGTGTVSALGGLNLGVSRFSKNVKAAKDFVRFASTDADVQLALAQRYSRAPTLKAAYDELAGDRVMALLNDILPVARPRPPAPAWSDISDEIQQRVFPVYTGQGRPEQAVKDIRAFLELTVGGT